MTLRLSLSALSLTVLSVAPALAQDASPSEPGSLAAAIADTKPIFDARLRYETVDQEGFDEDADALTLRLRAGFETGELAGTKLLMDFDYVEAIVGEYNSTLNLRTQYPVVADPEVTELNQLALVNSSIENTTIAVGRQRIIHDDARFLGNVGWRQDEQTFDAVRVQVAPSETVKIDLAYIDQVNRIFGHDGPAGTWDSQSITADVNAIVPLGEYRIDLSGFAYLLDFEDSSPVNSSQTYGGSIGGTFGPVAGQVRYAWQWDYADQPVDYAASYLGASGTYSAGAVALTGGIERLGSDDGDKAFSTPLATLHAFNGFADLFLTTPNAGLRDLYGTVAYTAAGVGPAKTLKVFATYHDFASTEGDVDYGSEVDIVAAAGFGRLSALLKYADYSADEFAGDREKLWLQLEWGF